MKAFYIALLLILSVTLSQGQTVYQKFLKKSDASGMLYRCIFTSDGGYASVGYLTDNLEFNDNFIIAKFNALGDQEWVKWVYSPDADEFSDIVETSDGGFVAVGTSYNLDNFIQYGVVVKFDENGTKVWAKTLKQSTLSFAARKIQKDESGNLYILGNIEVSGSTSDYCIVKMSPSGSILQQTSLGTQYSDQSMAFARNSLGEFFIVGSGNYGSAGGCIHAAKINPDMTVAWNTKFVGFDDYYAYDMKLKTNGNPVIAGRIIDGTGTLSALILELDKTTGATNWMKKYENDAGYNFFAYGLAVNFTERIAITGLVEEINPVAFVLETNSSGALNWAKKINSVNEFSSQGYGITRTLDNSYVVCGARAGIDSSTVQIFKLNPHGSASCISTDFAVTVSDISMGTGTENMSIGTAQLVAEDISLTETVLTTFTDACQPMAVPEPEKSELFGVYPNPSNGNFFLTCSTPRPDCRVTISSLSGVTVYENKALNQTVTQLNLDLSPGIYFIRMISNDKITTRQILIR